MNASFKIGCNFDYKLIEEVSKLNEEFEDKITEFYGSTTMFSELVARPYFRLPDLVPAKLEIYIKECINHNIEFCYTLNSIYPGSKENFYSKIKHIKTFIKHLEDMGVKRFIISNPLIAEVVNETTNLPIEISTIAHIDTISQMRYWKEHFNIDKICVNLMKNRSIKFLIKSRIFCEVNNIKLDLMVNEFCGVGSEDYTTHCIYRDSCYLCHAENVTKEDDMIFNNYPMKYCMSSRDTHPCNWLRLRWVRPEDIKRYVQIGINNFKITGRTGTTEYITKMCRAYMSRKWSGNLLQLWKPLETIQSGQNELDFKHKINIPNEKLDGFIDKWFNNLEHECSYEDCGITCKYCHDFYENNIK